MQIDQFDNELMDILGKRMKSVIEIGKYKKQNLMTILQTQRWDLILNFRVEQGLKLGISEEMVMSIFKSIHLESINKQEEILSKS
jgi:chorismate mutase